MRSSWLSLVVVTLLVAIACSSGTGAAPTEAVLPSSTSSSTSAPALPTSTPTVVAPTTTGAPSTTARSAPSTSTTAASVARGPCGTVGAAPTYTHVIWIWMENHSFGTIFGSAQAPYLNGLAKNCGLATNYHNISHPSLPNYIAATTGLSLPSIQAFDGDCGPSTSCSTDAPSIFGQGETWKVYEESMPSNCSLSDSGGYAVRHNPPVYLRALSGCGTFDVAYSQLATDLAVGTLPAFAFVTPNLIDDMHDGTIADGDTWLAHNLPAIFDSAVYRQGTTAVFVTWDEGEGGSSNDCAANTTDIGCHVGTVVASPSTLAGTTSATLFNHYSLLATAEVLLGLPTLGQAATAATMTAAFNL